MVALTYVLLKPRKIGNRVRQPGEVVPEAEFWKNQDAYISRGVISQIPADSLDEERRQRHEQFHQERAQRTTDPVPSPQEGTDVRESKLVADMTINQVKEIVERGEYDVDEVYEAERLGRQRSTLMEWLSEKRGDEDSSSGQHE